MEFYKTVFLQFQCVTNFRSFQLDNFFLIHRMNTSFIPCITILLVKILYKIANLDPESRELFSGQSTSIPPTDDVTAAFKSTKRKKTKKIKYVGRESVGPQTARPKPPNQDICT